jgi:nucleoid-associated protein YgaU
MMIHIYIVEAGDTLWSIAKKHLGKAARYQEIVRLNGLKTATLTAGQALQLPCA